MPGPDGVVRESGQECIERCLGHALLAFESDALEGGSALVALNPKP